MFSFSSFPPSTCEEQEIVHPWDRIVDQSFASGAEIIIEVFFLIDL